MILPLITVLHVKNESGTDSKLLHEAICSPFKQIAIAIDNDGELFVNHCAVQLLCNCNIVLWLFFFTYRNNEHKIEIYAALSLCVDRSILKTVSCVNKASKDIRMLNDATAFIGQHY